MQLPSVSGMFQSKLGAVRSSVPASFAGSFESLYASALDDDQSDDSGNTQELTIVPDALAQASQGTADGQTQDTDASAGGALQLVSSAQTGLTSTPRILYAASTSSSANSLPLFIPASKVSAYTSFGAAASGSQGQQIASYAKQFVGLPYVAGGENLQTGVDCSGFTQSVYKHFGISLPRTANSQSQVGTQVDPDNLKPGDLLFFKTADYAPVTHVEMYIGNGKVVQAAGKKWGVIISNLGNNWEEKKHFVIARRMTGL
jgi:cell wall-associated NlpC family hydrolase